MVLQIGRNNMEKITEEALSAYPFECCGLLIGHEDEANRTVVRTKPCMNESPEDRRVRYRIDPRNILEAEREIADSGTLLLGIYHSHPDYSANPSRFDLKHAWPWYSYLILSVNQGRFDEAASWRLTHDLNAFRREEWRLSEIP